jgi:hypothetical protein
MGQNLRDKGQLERKAVVSHLTAFDAKPKAMQLSVMKECIAMYVTVRIMFG